MNPIILLSQNHIRYMTMAMAMTMTMTMISLTFALH